MYIIQYNHFFRSGTLASESSTEARVNPHIRKKVTRQCSTISDVEKHHYESSSESIGSVAGTFESTFLRSPASQFFFYLVRTKTSPSPAAILEREVKIIRPTKNDKFKDERLVMVSSRCVPFMVCSFIPYMKSQRSSRPETKREGNRKRNTSGPRPLSALGDGLDPFDLLGIERGKDGLVKEIALALAFL